MKRIFLLGAVLAASLTAEQFAPLLLPFGMWPLCGKQSILGLSPDALCGPEVYMLMVRATTANTTGYVYEIRVTGGELRDVTATGYIPRTDMPDGKPSFSVFPLAAKGRNVNITVVEVVAVNTQKGAAK